MITENFHQTTYHHCLYGTKACVSEESLPPTATIALNVGDFFTLRLNNSNYPLWRELEHLLSKTLAPPEFEIPIDKAFGSGNLEPTTAFL